MLSKKRSIDREAFWRSVFEEFSASGLSIRGFCKQRGVSEPSFFQWRKKLQVNRIRRDENECKNGALIPVSVVDSVDGNISENGICPIIEIATPNGFTIRVPHNIDPGSLSRLLALVSGVSPSC